MQGTYNTNNLRLKGQKRILKAKKCQYPILPNGGEEDVSYDADKTSGDDPEVLGHCQVVEDSEHHHHVPKTEEAVLELTEHFLVVFEFEHSVDESEDYRQHDYGQSEGIEQRPPGGRPSQAELDVRNHKPECHDEDQNFKPCKIGHIIVVADGSNNCEDERVDEVHSTVTDGSVDRVGKEFEKILQNILLLFIDVIILKTLFLGSLTVLVLLLFLIVNVLLKTFGTLQKKETENVDRQEEGRGDGVEDDVSGVTDLELDHVPRSRGGVPSLSEDLLTVVMSDQLLLASLQSLLDPGELGHIGSITVLLSVLQYQPCVINTVTAVQENN